MGSRAVRTVEVGRDLLPSPDDYRGDEPRARGVRRGHRHGPSVRGVTLRDHGCRGRGDGEGYRLGTTPVRNLTSETTTTRDTGSRDGSVGHFTGDQFFGFCRCARVRDVSTRVVGEHVRERCEVQSAAAGGRDSRTSCLWSKQTYVTGPAATGALPPDFPSVRLRWPRRVVTCVHGPWTGPRRFLRRLGAPRRHEPPPPHVETHVPQVDPWRPQFGPSRSRSSSVCYQGRCLTRSLLLLLPNRQEPDSSRPPTSIGTCVFPVRSQESGSGTHNRHPGAQTCTLS